MSADPEFFSPYPLIVGITFTNEEVLKQASELFTKMYTLYGCNRKDSHSFFADNLWTCAKTLGFLKEPKFVEVANKISQDNEVMRGIIWRTHTLCWAAKNALHLEGDFVELGTYRGDTASFIYDYVELAQTNKKFYLYDIFEPHNTSHAMPHHSAELYNTVCSRFQNCPNVKVVKGEVPLTLHEQSPEKISFMHIDLNNADAEMGALELLFDRVVPGGMIVFDDYGWTAYQEQYKREYAFMLERGYRILEMPTGQGLVVKR